MWMSILRFFLIPILLNFFFFCSTPQPYWVKEKQQLFILSKDSVELIFYIEPDSDLYKFRQITRSIFDYLDLLKTYPYLTIKETRYHVIIYKDYHSYKTYRPFKIDSLAHFDRNHKLIHIPLDIQNHLLNRTTPSFVIYHELNHAILEECCKHYPIWLNEGLSFLLQNIAQSFECKKNTIYLPESLLRQKNELIDRRIHLPFYPDFDQIYDIYQQNLISILYVYYLFNSNQLLNYIQIINQDPKKELYFVFTKGNLHLYEKVRNDFYEWLKTIKGNRVINGC